MSVDKILQAVANYNKYRSPEATIKLIKFEDNEVKMQFSGSFCTTCGFYDYFEDFIIELQQLSDVIIKIDAIEEIGFQTFIVEYVIDG